MVIVPTYLDQDYGNFHVYLINDRSTDDTLQKIPTFLEDHPRKDRVTLIDNEERVGAMANYYAMVHALEDYLIVLNIDGDDWLVDLMLQKYLSC